MLKRCAIFWINREGQTMAFWIFMFVMNMLIPLPGSIIPVERGLKKSFDKYGNRR